jgi:hypothetical protein
VPVQISEAAQRGIITTDTAIGTGIGIALVDAVLEGDREQVERIHELFPAFELISAAAAAERSALALTGLFSRDFVFSLHDAHRQTLNYREFVLRRRDRIGSGCILEVAVVPPIDRSEEVPLGGRFSRAGSDDTLDRFIDFSLFGNDRFWDTGLSTASS